MSEFFTFFKFFKFRRNEVAILPLLDWMAICITETGPIYFTILRYPQRIWKLKNVFGRCERCANKDGANVRFPYGFSIYLFFNSESLRLDWMHY